jgi:hypothetical protein
MIGVSVAVLPEAFRNKLQAWAIRIRGNKIFV